MLPTPLISECTDDILTDAKQRKKEWEEKLFRMEIENLLHQRDTLIAIACVHKMEANDCQENLKDTRANVSRSTLSVYVCVSNEVSL